MTLAPPAGKAACCFFDKPEALRALAVDFENWIWSLACGTEAAADVDQRRQTSRPVRWPRLKSVSGNGESIPFTKQRAYRKEIKRAAAEISGRPFACRSASDRRMKLESHLSTGRAAPTILSPGREDFALFALPF